MQTIQKLAIDSDKLKKEVERSVLVSTIVSKMEARHSAAFLLAHKHQTLYKLLCRNEHAIGAFGSATEFTKEFSDAMKVNYTSNKYYTEYQKALTREMDKFNGRVTVSEGAETNSEATTATKLTKTSSQAQGGQKTDAQRSGSPGALDENIDEAATLEDAHYRGDECKEG